mmetsp:Transcript_67348/g.119070  ORF Transcript_67348/g.119070 Transcript_67348/m.119070 type:complete len:218 (-) Transcript_67348:536-1189(-)
MLCFFCYSSNSLRNATATGLCACLPWLPVMPNAVRWTCHFSTPLGAIVLSSAWPSSEQWRNCYLSDALRIFRGAATAATCDAAGRPFGPIFPATVDRAVRCAARCVLLESTSARLTVCLLFDQYGSPADLRAVPTAAGACTPLLPVCHLAVLGTGLLVAVLTLRGRALTLCTIKRSWVCDFSRFLFGTTSASLCATCPLCPIRPFAALSARLRIAVL